MNVATVTLGDSGFDTRWDRAETPDALLALLRDFDRSRPQRMEEIQSMQACTSRFADPRIRYASLAIAAGHHIRASTAQRLDAVLAEAKANQVDDPDLDWARWRILLSEAILVGEQGDLIRSEHLATEARDLALGIDDGDLLAETYGYLATLASDRGTTTEALRYARQAIAAGSPTSWGRAFGSWCIARTFHHQGAYSEAIQIQRSVIEADRTRPLSVAQDHLVLAVFGIDANRLDIANQAVADADALIQAIGSPPRLGAALAFVNAKLAVAEQRFGDAAHHLNDCQSINDDLGVRLLQSECDVVLVQLAVSSRRYEAALSISDTVDVIPLSITDRQNLYRSAAEAAEKLQRHHEANRWLRRLVATYEERRVAAQDLLDTLALLRETEAVKRKNDELERSINEREELVGLITHDIRGGLASLGLALDLWANEIGNDKAERIWQMVNNYASLIDLLGPAAPTKNIQGQTRFGEVFATMAKELDLVTASRGGSTTYAVEEIDECTVPLGVDEFTAIMRNLVQNAAKYSGTPPRVTITASATEHTVRIGVADNGAGIPAPEREAIFADGYRQEIHHHQEGTGSGLFHTRRLVEGAGGTISVGDNPQGGATFWVELPRHDRDPVAA